MKNYDLPGRLARKVSPACIACMPPMTDRLLYCITCMDGDEGGQASLKILLS